MASSFDMETHDETATLPVDTAGLDPWLERYREWRVADRTNMLENSVYSVITVEGCASILWKDGKSQELREKAASALRITAQDLQELRVIDEIIPEPLGGAHSNHEETAKAVHDTLARQIEDLRRYKPDKLVRRRRDKFLRMGQFLE